MTAGKEVTMDRMLVLAPVLSAVLAVPLAAQRDAGAFDRWEIEMGSPDQARWFVPDAARSAETPRRDYRYEGLAIGGIAFGTLGAWLGSKVSLACPTQPGIRCNADRLERGVTLGLVAGAFGAALGYIVGRLSPKPSTSETH
ncbi:MAG TPA: hypothetical protein VFH26_00140 [Gemmatimonadales bacterium]|nr:hypothetical protein [Gemmatimonadales bacterium]